MTIILDETKGIWARV